MARHFISTAKFNPYTYQELAAPIERTTAILAQQAQNLSALEMQNAALGNYLDPELDKDAYNIYKQNEAALHQAVDDLQRTGLNSNTYNTLRNAHLAYAKDIKPMQSAIMNRVQYYASLNDLLLKNPDAVIKGPMKRPLSEFYNGIPQTHIVQGNAIQKDVSDIMQRLAAAEAEVKAGGDISKYNMAVYKLTGYTADQIRQLQQDPDSFLYAIIHSVMQKHGVEDAAGHNLLNSPEDYAKMWQYANTGVYSLLGTKTADVADNGRYKDVQIAHSNRDYNLRAQQAQFEHEVALAQTAYNMAAVSGADPEQVYQKLKEGNVMDAMSLGSNNSKTPSMTFNNGNVRELRGQPTSLRTNNALASEVNNVVQTSATIGKGSNAFKPSTVRQAYGAAIKGRDNIKNISNKNYYKAICARVGCKNPDNPDPVDWNLIVNAMKNDYLKLDYNPFLAVLTINPEYVNTHVARLKILSPDTEWPDKITELTYKTNPSNPLQIDVFLNGSTKKATTTISVFDKASPINNADQQTLQLMSKGFPFDYMDAIQDPSVPANIAIEKMQNATTVGVSALDFFVTSINSEVVDQKKKLDTNPKND